MFISLVGVYLGVGSTLNCLRLVWELGGYVGGASSVDVGWLVQVKDHVRAIAVRRSEAAFVGALGLLSDF